MNNMKNDQRITDEFLATLKDLCRAFDNEHGDYPEDEWEGRSLFEFACEQSGKNQDFAESDEYESWPNQEPQSTGDPNET